MLGSHNHKGYTEKSIGTGCIDTKVLVCSANLEVNESTCRLTYPVYLLLLYLRKVVNALKTLKKSVGILGYS